MTIKHVPPDVDDDVVDVGHYARVLRNHKGLLVLGLLLGLLAGVAAALAHVPSYTAEAEIVVQPVGAGDATSGLNSDAGVNIQTQQQIASSAAVAELVADKLQTADSTSELLSGLTVSVPGRSNVLSFAYTSTEPQQAQLRAQTFAEAYLERRRDAGTDAVQGTISTIEKRVKTLQDELVAVRAKLDDATDGSSGARNLAVRQQVLQQQLAPLQGRLGQLSTVVVQPGEVIQSAALPAAPSPLGAALLIAAGAVLGLLLGLVFAFLRARTDKRVRTAYDIEETLQLPVLASIAVPGRSKSSADLGARGYGVAHEVLVARLLVAARRAQQTMVTVASPTEGEQSHDVARSLSSAMADMGLRVALVDAGNDAGSVPGLPTGQVVWPERRPLLVGLRPGEPGHGSGPEHVRRVLAELRAAADFVIVASPPVLTRAETLLIAAETDTAVLVAETGVTRVDELAEAASSLDEIDATVLGVVVMPNARRMRRATRGRVEAPATSSAPPAVGDPVRAR